MAVTGLGKRFARMIYAGSITISDVPAAHVENTRESYEYLFGEVLED